MPEEQLYNQLVSQAMHFTPEDAQYAMDHLHDEPLATPASEEGPQ